MPNTTPHALDVTDEDEDRALDAAMAAAPSFSHFGGEALSDLRVALRAAIEADRAALASARPREEPTDCIGLGAKCAKPCGADGRCAERQRDEFVASVRETMAATPAPTRDDWTASLRRFIERKTLNNGERVMMLRAVDALRSELRAAEAERNAANLRASDAKHRADWAELLIKTHAPHLCHAAGIERAPSASSPLLSGSEPDGAITRAAFVTWARACPAVPECDDVFAAVPHVVERLLAEADTNAFSAAWAKAETDVLERAALASARVLTPEALAQRFHETYERLAPEFAYETRPASRVPWDAVPSPNRALMAAVCAEIMSDLAASARPQGAEACSTCGAPDFLFCACGALEAVRRHIAERTDGDCDGDNAQWDGGFKAACSQILAILDARPTARPTATPDGPDA